MNMVGMIVYNIFNIFREIYQTTSTREQLSDIDFESES